MTEPKSSVDKQHSIADENEGEGGKKTQEAGSFCCGKWTVFGLIFYFIIWPQFLPFPSPREQSQTNVLKLHFGWTVHLKAHLTFEETALGDLHLPVGSMSQVMEFYNDTNEFLEKIIWSNRYNTLKWTYQGMNDSIISVSNFYGVIGASSYAINCTVPLKIERKIPNTRHLAIKPGRYPCSEETDFTYLIIDKFELRKHRHHHSVDDIDFIQN